MTPPVVCEAASASLFAETISAISSEERPLLACITSTSSASPTAAHTPHATEHELPTVHYALFDVEGFEPLVLQGMALHTERGRRRFPTFQWEAVYDAWGDSRHPRVISGSSSG